MAEILLSVIDGKSLEGKNIFNIIYKVETFVYVIKLSGQEEQ